MKGNKVTTKIKEFWQKHRNAIIFGAGCAAGAYVGHKYTLFRFAIGLKDVCDKNPGLEETLCTAIDNACNPKT